MTPVAPEPIIIVKKKGNHGGHHGGAWKVAYADFVTAMMALFIVLWLTNTSADVKKAISGYFKDPNGYGKQAGTNSANSGEALELKKADISRIKEKLEEMLQKAPEFKGMKDHVEMSITGEGLRIELLETEKGMFFESGKPVPSPHGVELLARLANELGKLPNHLLIEGHTDSAPFGSEDYTNWELSGDRANAARRVMRQNGLRADQVTQVRGFADQRLRRPETPRDASNRRVSVVVQKLQLPPQTPKPDPKPVASSKPSPAGKH